MEAEDAEHHVALTHCFKPIAHARQEQRRRWNLHFDNPNLYVFISARTSKARHQRLSWPKFAQLDTPKVESVTVIVTNTYHACDKISYLGKQIFLVYHFYLVINYKLI